MQPVIRRSGFVHQMRVLSPEFPRYLSHSINIPSHAQCPEHDHRDVYGWTARNLQREPCISHDGRGKIVKLVVARRLEAQKADPRCTSRTVTEGQQVQHRSACTDASGASGFTTVAWKGRGAAAGAAIGCSKSSSVFSHRPPASRPTRSPMDAEICEFSPLRAGTIGANSDSR